MLLRMILGICAFGVTLTPGKASKISSYEEAAAFFAEHQPRTLLIGGVRNPAQNLQSGWVLASPDELTLNLDPYAHAEIVCDAFKPEAVRVALAPIATYLQDYPEQRFQEIFFERVGLFGLALPEGYEKYAPSSGHFETALESCKFMMTLLKDGAEFHYQSGRFGLVEHQQELADGKLQNEPGLLEAMNIKMQVEAYYRLIKHEVMPLPLTLFARQRWAECLKPSLQKPSFLETLPRLNQELSIIDVTLTIQPDLIEQGLPICCYHIHGQKH